MCWRPAPAPTFCVSALLRRLQWRAVQMATVGDGRTKPAKPKPCLSPLQVLAFVNRVREVDSDVDLDKFTMEQVSEGKLVRI